MNSPLLLVLLTLFLFVLYRLLKAIQSYKRNQAIVESRNIPYVKQFIPYHTLFFRFVPRFISKHFWATEFLYSDQILNEIKRLGNPPLFGMVYYSDIIIFVLDPQLVKEICVSKKSSFPKPIHLYKILDLFGQNIVSAPDGPVWKKHRTTTNAAFGEDNNQLVCRSTVRNAKQMFVKWDSEEKPVNITKDFVSITLSVITEASSGQVFNLFEDEKSVPLTKDFQLSFREVMRIVSTDCLPRLILPDWVFRVAPSKYLKRVDLGFKEFVKYAQIFIKEKRETPNAQNKDILSLISNDPNLSDQDVIANTYIFLLAGHETTAHTLEFCFGTLSTRPDVQEKIYQEAERVLSNANEEDYYKLLPQLEYTRAVFEETLRLYPPVISIPKTTTEETILGDYSLPPNTMVSLAVYAMSHSPTIWDNPKEFRPERFLPVTKDSSGTKFAFTPTSFIPFSYGNRSCMGRKFAYIEGTVILALSCWKYKFSPHQVDLNNLTYNIALQPKHPQLIKVTPRNKSV